MRFLEEWGWPIAGVFGVGALLIVIYLLTGPSKTPPPCSTFANESAAWVPLRCLPGYDGGAP